MQLVINILSLVMWGTDQFKGTIFDHVYFSSCSVLVSLNLLGRLGPLLKGDF